LTYPAALIIVDSVHHAIQPVMQAIQSPTDVTTAALAVMQRTTDPRLREIMTVLVKHLHGFVTEARLTEAEFRQAASVINAIGQCSNETHNEAVLMAGSLGVSQLVCLLNNGNQGQTATSQNLLGPFWRLHSPATANGASIVRGPTPGAALFVRGLVVDRQGRPVADALVDVWQASPAGFYENQDPQQAPMNLRGQFTTNAQGHFWLRSVKPIGYAIPTNGIVGKLLAAQNRHPMRPAHLHALIVKPGFKTLISQVYAHDDPHLDTDVQFGVTAATVGQYVAHPEPHPTELDVVAPWYTLDYTYVMEEGASTLPKPPIK
jgi:catechol 1,2-dioxygenase